MSENRPSVSDEQDLIRRFRSDPEGAYSELLERYTPIILRMIRRFLRDQDEVMEVYTSICERFQAHEYQALVRFRPDSDLMPWLSVVTANACRDQLRKQRALSVPRSVMSKLDEFEELVFKYYYWQRLPHEEIAEIIKSKHARSCSPLEVMRAIGKINELLSINKRWMLLAALNANQPTLSVEELAESGFQPESGDDPGRMGEEELHQAAIRRLTAALKELDEDDQVLILLRFEHGMTAPQIAEVMNFDSHKYVYTRLRTVIGRLRRMLDS